MLRGKYNDLRCQSRNSMIGINLCIIYTCYLCYMFRPLSGHPQAKQITLTRNYIGQCFILPDDDPIMVKTCSINNKYKLNQFIPIIELRD
jgi:hypothetical protein